MAAITDKKRVELLFKSINEICNVRKNIISDYKAYDFSMSIDDLRKKDILGNYIKFYVNDNQNRIISIQKPTIKQCPEPDKSIKSWIKTDWQEPVNNIPYEERDEVTGELFTDKSSRVTAYMNWMERRAQWLREYKYLKLIDDVFSRIYAINESFKVNPDERELLFGFGVFRTVRKTFEIIQHPLFTKRLRIDDFDIKNNIITIYDTDSDIKFESSFLSKIENASIRHIPEISQAVSNFSGNPFVKDDIESFLQIQTHQLSKDAEYINEYTKRSMNHDYEVTYEPLLIVRSRESGLSDFIERVIHAVSEDEVSIPQHLINLLNPVDNVLSPSEQDREPSTIEKRLAATSGEDPDIYMTKPANKEQLRIAQEIETHAAVEVQGPPGTGKTHTIANLIGHFLAQGKTLLITSEKVKALTVLKDKLDEEIKPLCVSVFEDNNDELKTAAQAIMGKVNLINELELGRQIEELKNKRQSLISNLDSLRKEIFLARNNESKGISYAGNSYSVIDVAKQVAEHTDELEIIPGEIEANDFLPLTIKELGELYETNGLITLAEEEELALNLPDYHAFMVPEDFNRAIHKIKSFEEQVSSFSCIDSKLYQDDYDTDSMSYNHKKIFIHPQEEELQEAKKLLDSFEPLSTLQQSIIQDVEMGSSNTWKALHEKLINFLEVYVAFRTKTLDKEINFNTDLELQRVEAALDELAGEFTNSGSIGRIFKWFHSDAATALNSIRINGRAMSCASDVLLVKEKLAIDTLENEVKVAWNRSLAVYEGIPAYQDVTGNKQLRVNSVVEEIEKALKWKNEWHDVFLKMLQAAGFNMDLLERRRDFGLKFLDYVGYLTHQVRDFIDLAIFFSARRKVKLEIDKAASIFQSDELRNSRLGSCLYMALLNHDCDGYSEQYHEYVLLYRKYPVYSQRCALLGKLKAAAPDWERDIRNRVGIHGKSLVPGNLEEAWKIKCFDSILRDLFAESLGAKQHQIEEYENHLRKTTALLANSLAWLHLKKTLNGKQTVTADLQTWMTLLKKIGKGTGKYAASYRKDAKKCMKNGQRAIPVWIIPVRRALETFDPINNHFDIAIIDEASQSSLEALAITALADKIIVVGDDKQVSPMNIGTNIDQIQEILKRNLSGILTNWQLFDGRTSLYELVGGSFAPIMLREHFRCVPAIIGYCNEKFYEGQILPLRDSSTSTLFPSIVNYRVAAKRDGRIKTNKQEAITVVSLMLACWEQPEYKGKTFGVISLLGDDQAQEIQSLLIKHFADLEEIKERQFVCGNAASFQGDERDVMFLSMVDDNNSARKLTATDFKKRYNVAVSRAKDQLWLVHSLDYTSLQTDDLRYGLLEYTVNYKAHLAKTIEIKKKSDSPFEEEVAQYLNSKGYPFVQQYEVGSYRIDIVVQYGHKKIAIECDGEQFHSTESQIEHDMERQCILERLGWKFIRIRGGKYYRDKEATMKRVLVELEKAGFYPETAENSTVHDDDELYNRIIQRAEVLRKTWNPQLSHPDNILPEAPTRDDGKDKSNAGNNAEAYIPEDLFGPSVSNLFNERHKKNKEVSEPNTNYGHTKMPKQRTGYYQSNELPAIKLGQTVKVEKIKTGETKRYVMMKNPRGKLTELTRVCLQHRIGDIITYQGENLKILEVE